MKKCCTCHQLKDEVEFNKNRTRRDGLNGICKECSRKRSRKYYQEQGEKHRAVCAAARRIASKGRRQRIGDLKRSIGCQVPNCCENEPCALDFHHVGGKKELITKMMGHGWKTILAEIRKCVVVCANDHRKIHAGLIPCPAKLIEIEDEYV